MPKWLGSHAILLIGRGGNPRNPPSRRFVPADVQGISRSPARLLEKAIGTFGLEARPAWEGTTGDAVPRKPTLSPTRLTTYIACPVKYMWTYVDPRGRRYLRAKSYYSFGTTLHRVLERFHDEGDVGVTTKGDALRIFEENWVDAGYRSQEEMEQAQGLGREILENHIEQTLAKPTGGRVLAVERRLRTDLGDFALLGVVDRLDEYPPDESSPSGRIDIVDYKSGRRSITSEDVRGDLAMGTYALLVHRIYPEARITASIHAIRTGATATADFPPEEIALFEQDLLDLGRQILNTNWEEKVPVPKRLCNECDFLLLCRQHPQYDERQIPPELPGEGL